MSPQTEAALVSVASLDIRECVLSMWDLVAQAKQLTFWFRSKDARGQCRSLHDFRAYLMYSVEHPSRRKRHPMDVEDLVRKWVPIIRGLSTAHEKAPLDQCEFE